MEGGPGGNSIIWSRGCGYLGARGKNATRDDTLDMKLPEWKTKLTFKYPLCLE